MRGDFTFKSPIETFARPSRRPQLTAPCGLPEDQLLSNHVSGFWRAELKKTDSSDRDKNAIGYGAGRLAHHVSDQQGRVLKEQGWLASNFGGAGHSPSVGQFIVSAALMSGLELLGRGGDHLKETNEYYICHQQNGTAECDLDQDRLVKRPLRKAPPIPQEMVHCHHSN